MNKNKQFVKSLLVVLLFLIKPGGLSAQSTDCNISESALQEASKIRGLNIKKAVPCLLHDKDKVKQYIHYAIEKQLPSEKLKYEEMVFKELGLIPREFDYKNGVVELYLSQIGGYYDPEKEHYVMASWLPAIMQDTIAVHELTHALQDQYYSLDDLINPKIENGDKLLAHSALAEGDASAVMFDYSRKQAGQAAIANDANVDSLIYSTLMSSSAAFASNNIPKSLQSLLIFPYTSGLRFVHSILIKEGYAGIDKIFKNPPQTTEQILHPEKYGSKKIEYLEFSESDLRALGVPENFQKKYEDTFGEFAISSLLVMGKLDPAEAPKAAAGWGGDRLMLFADSNESLFMLFWKTHWDTENEAKEFYDAINKHFLERKGKVKIWLDKTFVNISITI